jgi:hypothetical protein
MVLSLYLFVILVSTIIVRLENFTEFSAHDTTGGVQFFAKRIDIDG